MVMKNGEETCSLLGLIFENGFESACRMNWVMHVVTLNYEFMKASVDSL